MKIGRGLSKDLCSVVLVSFWCIVVYGLAPNITQAKALTVTPLPILKVGVLKFGTINWQMNVIKHHKLDAANGFSLEVIPFASKNASAVALQSGAVDIIMTDLFWVSRQRSQGKPFVIMPTVKATGGVYTTKGTSLTSLMDSKTHSIGIAGGSVDKNWLLFQAYAKQQNINIADQLNVKFAAPPLLNRLMLSGDLDSSINFWHYNARLEAAGMVLVLPVTTMLSSLGIQSDIPLLGWVFDENFATESSLLLKGFLRASFSAKQRLSEQSEEWERIAHLIKAENETVFNRLRTYYPETLLTNFTINEINATQQLFDVYRSLGGHDLLGQKTAFDANIYWSEAMPIWLSQQ